MIVVIQTGSIRLPSCQKFQRNRGLVMVIVNKCLTVSAAQFAVMFQEECAAVAKKAFGEITLSLGEVKKVAGEITFAKLPTLLYFLISLLCMRPARC